MSGSKPTTETILEQLKNTPLQNIVVRIGEAQYLLSLPMMKALAWNAIPDMIKDENSPAAQKNGLLRTGIKTLIRPLLPELLKQTWGEPVEVTPRLNILTWLSSYFVHLIMNLVASREWVIHVENCESCGASIYKVVGVSTNPNNSTPPPSLAEAPAIDQQPLQGGG